MTPDDRQHQATPAAAPSGTKSMSEMAARYNVSLGTLRFYEERGLLFPRILGLARFYCPTDELRLQIIQKGKRLGFSLAEIAGLLSAKNPNGEEAQLRERSELPAGPTKQQIADQIRSLEERRRNVDAAIADLRSVVQRDK